MKNRIRELRTAAGMTQQLAGLVLLLLLGGADMSWAFSRKACLPREDEQDRHISEKSAWRLP